MYFDLKNRIYVVTGASGGIGSALVNLLNKEGAELFLIDTDQTSLDQLKKEQATHQNQNYFINSNLKDFKEIKDNLHKPISGIIHLAGHLESDNVNTSKKPIWERAIQNNLTNAYDIIENLIPFFDKNIIGKIILTSSLAYRRGGFDFIPYTASKGGITGLVRAYSRKLAPEILVNGLAPGIIDTKMPKKLIENRGDELLKQIPQKRFGKPEEVASVILFLLSEAASYINGQIINIDGGIINS